MASCPACGGDARVGRGVEKGDGEDKDESTSDLRPGLEKALLILPLVKF